MSTISVFENEGGKFTLRLRFCEYGGDSIVIDDFNGDGAMDIGFANHDSGITLLLQGL